MPDQDESLHARMSAAHNGRFIVAGLFAINLASGDKLGALLAVFVLCLAWLSDARLSVGNKFAAQVYSLGTLSLLAVLAGWTVWGAM